MKTIRARVLANKLGVTLDELSNVIHVNIKQPNQLLYLPMLKLC